MTRVHFITILLACFPACLRSVDAESNDTSEESVRGIPEPPATDDLVVYERGNMPVIILVPHDGTVKPAGLPLRKQDARDVWTSLLARAVSDQLTYTDSSGVERQPHLVINLASRAVVEPNISWEDNVKRGWFDSDNKRTEPPARAKRIHSDFHACADYAVMLVQAQYGRGILVDLHGLAAQVPLDMYGYIIRGQMFRCRTGDGPATDEALAKLIRKTSTMQYAASRKKTDRDVADILRGPKSLASLVDRACRALRPQGTAPDGQVRGRPATPSAQFPNPTGKDSPIHGKVYFNGSYDIRAHSSLQEGIHVDAVQIETTADARNNKSQRLLFARCLATAIRDFLSLHYDLDIAPPAEQESPANSNTRR